MSRGGKSLARGIKIDSSIPVPRDAQWKDVLASMKPGDSVLLTFYEANGFYSAALAAHLKVVTRKEGEMRRCWLVGKREEGT